MSVEDRYKCLIIKASELALYFGFAYLLCVFKVVILPFSPHTLSVTILTIYLMVMVYFALDCTIILPSEKEKERQLIKIIDFAHKRVLKLSEKSFQNQIQNGNYNSHDDILLLLHTVRFGDIIKAAAYTAKAYHRLHLHETFGEKSWNQFVTCLGGWLIANNLKIDYNFDPGDLASLGKISDEASTILLRAISDIKETLVFLEDVYEKTGTLPKEHIC